MIKRHGEITGFVKVATMYQCLKANRVLHRDLKPQNILVNLNQDSDLPPRLKFADFGRFFFLTSFSSFRYRAPEIMLGQEKYSISVDIGRKFFLHAGGGV